jgi:hypothetical protein
MTGEIEPLSHGTRDNQRLLGQFTSASGEYQRFLKGHNLICSNEYGSTVNSCADKRSSGKLL